ncbi:DUF2283 domain-containing protein [Prochlorothrix hollandica]|uniref:DUF2283 domain-containing protein n=1 Tax=Prochlorothrix hollandica PCC 9006 = CALU 1027 TaxID=317619 RepID=A0A0M2PN11_PROHO|nr:DUF2283 domain-containing protein [Prochlorothrix hollandica]KKI97995.1 hypothetical protein PROH_19745 [Prochlorothrix hollandica PCC 9006 = CALU 1027]
MKLTIHKEDDAIYLRLDESEVFESEEVQNGIILDYNAQGKVIGVEILYLSQRSPQALQQVLLETTP